ncbi:hypothetical protein ZIOFF_032571 [Zingiber officinale]|uniref:CCHC-type domain-containing protein n=3 Tax=Zingiber officinale TaxID=94328 RepID=A0A8J5L6H4_ZINOF|nr:hypothetical protein ZIOFF_032571 [Zingiber officinale]
MGSWEEVRFQAICWRDHWEGCGCASENVFCLFGKISVGVQNWFHLSIPQVWWFFSDLWRRLWMPRFVVDREDCLKMSKGSRSPPRDRRIRTERTSYRDAPYRRDFPRASRYDLCKNCKRPGHYARECPNAAVCNSCGLPGHIASECTTKSLCWNCKEPGHLASNCPNEGICHTCGKAGHLARDCSMSQLPPGDLRLCNNCYKQGHLAADCTNEKACNNCRKTGHLARDCTNEPVCNLCNVAGHVARQCPKSGTLGTFGGGFGAGGFGGGFRGGYQDVICRNCNQVGHMSRDCMGALMICHNCGGRGHMAYECPSSRFMDRGFRRY